jgi:hypothetical protein
MSKAVALAMTFKRPAKFNLAAYWKTSTAELSRLRERYAAVLALAPEAVASLSGWCPLSPAGDVRHGKEIPDAWAIHKVDFESLAQAQFVAMGFGPQVQVIAPDELRDRVHLGIAQAHGAISARGSSARA